MTKYARFLFIGKLFSNLLFSLFFLLDYTYAVGPEYFCENLNLFVDSTLFNFKNILTSSNELY